MKLYTSCLGKRLKLAAALALTATLLLPGTGCAKDENPPVIQQSHMPEWAVEGENIDLTVRTADDRGVKEVYVQLDSGDKIPLTKVDSQKNGEEVANWQASFKLSPKDYSYSIVAKDIANEARKEGKIAVYSKNSLYGYARNKGIDTYLSQLSNLEKNGTVDDNGKAFIDLVAKYTKAGELVPVIYAEILKLPDLMMVDEKDIEAAEDMLMLASNPKYKDAFESMLNEGIPDKGKYCSPLEALLWIAYDKEFEEHNPLSNYSVDKLISDAWRNTTTSQKYSSERWQDFDKVVDRLNSPQLVTIYCIDNFPYDWTKWNAYLATGRPQGIWEPKKTFTEKKGACMDQSAFVYYCLRENGYSSENFNINKDNGVCWLSAGTRDFPYVHFTCSYIEGGNFYVIDVGRADARGIKGPFKTIEEVADATYQGWGAWGAYCLYCAGGKIVTR